MKYEITYAGPKESKAGMISVFTVNGEDIKVADCAKLLGLNPATVHNAIRRYEELSDINQWFNDSAIRFEYRLTSATTIYWRDGYPCWAPAITECIKITSQSVCARLRKWELGDLDCDELFKPPNSGMAAETMVVLNYTPKEEGMQIRAEMTGSMWAIHINGKAYKVTEAARKLEMSRYTLGSELTARRDDPDYLQQYLDSIAWRADLGISQSEKVYMNKESKRSSVSVVLSRVGNISDTGARTRLNRWVRGATDEYLYGPVGPHSQNAKKNRDIDLADVPQGDLAHLGNKAKPCPNFRGTKWDRMMVGVSSVDYNIATIRS